MPPKPVVGPVPPKRPSPVVGKVAEKRRFNFSFRFFRQQRYFGLGQCDASWFVSFLEKLAELSNKYHEDLMKNLAEKDMWRLHSINWLQKGMPIKREDLNWIDKKYLGNVEDYEFLQFQLTTSLGRVIGFWDDSDPSPVFNIVLLDPHHNAQPVKRFDYRVRETTIAKGEFAVAISRIEAAIKDCGPDCGCRTLYGVMQSSLTNSIPYETMLVPMHPALFESVKYYIESGTVTCVAELLEYALSNLE